MCVSEERDQQVCEGGLVEVIAAREFILQEVARELSALRSMQELCVIGRGELTSVVLSIDAFLHRVEHILREERVQLARLRHLLARNRR